MNKTSITLRLAEPLSKEVKEKASSSSTTVTEYLTRLITRGLQFEREGGTDYRLKIQELEGEIQQLDKDKVLIKDRLEYVKDELDQKVSSLRTENASIKGEVKTLKEVVLAGIQRK
jgi:hypothetical protein